MAPRDPGPMVWVHPLMIGFGVLAAVAYGAWELTQGGDGGWMRGGLSLIVAAALLMYLRSLRGTIAKRLTPRS